MRVVAVGCPHHVTQRGSGRRPVFLEDRDREAYLETLREYTQRYRLEIWGYCLMSNHVHLIAIPTEEDSMAKALGRTHSDYARYANLLRRGCGHFWQARFYSCPLGPSHRWAALAYIETNPVRAGIVNSAADYPWSSARAHLRDRDPRQWLALAEWRLGYTPERWAQVLGAGLAEEAFRERFRRATESGLPLGDQAFVREWGKRRGRDLEVRRPGRPVRVEGQSAAG